VPHSTLNPPPRRFRIWRAVLAGVTAATGGEHVDVRIGGAVTRDAGADFQHRGVGATKVLQAMAVGVARLEARAVARAKQFGTRIGRQRDFTR